MSGTELSNTYALILAGGSGTRFWPVSRTLRPKQLLSLFDAQDSMLELTVSRMRGLLPAENILVLTNSDQEDAVREILKDRLPGENIVAEPEKRDTAPAIALALGWVAARDPQATMVVVPSDQLIQDQNAFCQTMRQAVGVAVREQGIVTIGIKPTWPCTAYGYIQRGQQISSVAENENVPTVYQVDCFREKPNTQLATEFIEQGNFSWNAGIFVWRVPTVISELEQHCPDLAHFVADLQKSVDFNQTVQERFSQLPKISIDYALMEKASCVFNIEAAFDWDDLGNWVSAGKYFDRDKQGNACNSALSSVDSNNNVVYAEDKVRVALLGVNNLIVVQTSDAILVAAKEAMDGMKELVDEVPDELK